MATFKLSRLSNPDILKRIEPTRLVRFLSPYCDYLLRRGMSFGQAPLDYEKLASILMSPDEGLPNEMVTALFMVDAVADEDAMERLVETAQKRAVILDVGDDPTPADVAVALWLAAPALLEEGQAEIAVHRVKRFEYYSGALRRCRDFPDFSQAKLDEIALRLKVFFADRKKSATARVFPFQSRDKLHLAIRHGSAMRREGSVTDDGKSSTAVFRPEIHDVLAYDRGMDVLGLKAGSMAERAIYRDVIGDVLFGDSTYFDTPFNITLAPLSERGPEVLNCEDVPGMASVKLVEICRVIGGAYRQRQINQATDLFAAIGDDWHTRLRSSMLASVKFEVRLGEGPAKRCRKVTLAKPNYAKFDRDDEAEIIELWLRRRGFLPEPAEGKHNGRISISVVANADRTPASIDASRMATPPAE